MSSARYERLPSSPKPQEDDYDLSNIESSAGLSRTPPQTRITFAHDPRFELPTPPVWQRAGLIATLIFLFWLGFRLRGSPEDEGIPALIE